MAAATVSDTEYGYYVTGGTDATTIYTGKKYIRTIFFTPASTADTATLTSNKGGKNTAVNCMEFKSAGTAGVPQFAWHLDDGVPYDNLAVTLSNASGHLYVIVRA